ncbi:hypothetical protein CEXT_445861 [Caerostris extrusa]|uniref:Uncharacterized protein n=1 Tax=Caerostris extrusa TaxID=172846 RepID=A0AAV4USW5_CAEEX|nr:hypothetical protein CEXT_445861 [Caerostris extrusa]
MNAWVIVQPTSDFSLMPCSVQQQTSASTVIMQEKTLTRHREEQIKNNKKSSLTLLSEIEVLRNTFPTQWCLKKVGGRSEGRSRLKASA